MSNTAPDNYVLHVHDGFVYAFTLDEDGDLAQVPNLGLKPDDINANVRLAWDRVEKRLPQTEPERDEESGELYAPEPTQCAYVASARFMLAEVEGKRKVGPTELPEKLAVQARHLLVSTEPAEREVPYANSPEGMEEAHAEGEHDELPREGCPACKEARR